MTKVKLELSIIIPSYNTKELLGQCLAAIYRETKRLKFEVIVVDNGSKDGSVKLVKKQFSQVKLIALKKNVGYGKANNLGAQKAQGQWLLFLNSDTLILKGGLDVLFKRPLLKRKNLVIGCRLLNKDRSIQPSAGFFPTIFRVGLQMLFIDDLPGVKKVMKPYQQDERSFYQKDQSVDWVTGAFLALSRELFFKVNGFDEQIFMYAEEVDLCYRLKKLGSKVEYRAYPEVIHYKGASAVDGFTAAVIGEYQGLLAFFEKHKSSWQQPVIRLFLYLGGLLRLVLFGMLDKQKRKTYGKVLKKI